MNGLAMPGAQRWSILIGCLVWLLTGCGDPPADQTEPSFDASLADLRSADDVGVSDTTANPAFAIDRASERSFVELLGLYDVGSADTTSDATDPICALGPQCVSANTIRYCVDGQPQDVLCPDGFTCLLAANECLPVICNPADDLCVDDQTAQQCVDDGTRLDTIFCRGCVDGMCPDTCADGAQRCVGEFEYERCHDGEWLVESCVADDLGTECSAGACRTACERAALASDYAGCVFWSVDLDNIVDASGNGPGADGVAVVVSNLSEYPAQIEVEASAFGNVLTSAVLEPGDIETLELPPQNLLGTRLHPGAYRITSSVPVLAYQFNPLNREGTSSTDASLLLPESALGDRYRVMSFPAQGSNQRGFVTVIGVGLESTTVSLTPNGQTIAGVEYRAVDGPIEVHRLDALEAGQTVVRTLEPFDVWQVETTPDSDLTGSLVLSDRPVAVFSGTRCSNIPEGVPNCDHLEHQMLAVASWDRSYVATPGPVRGTESTTFRVLADFDRTLIDATPTVAGTPTTLAAGDVFTFEVTQATALVSTEPIMLGQYLASADAGAAGLGDPSFTIIPPVEQFRDAYVFYVPDNYESDTVTLIRESDEAAEIVLDGIDLTAALGDIFTPIDGTNYEVADIIIDDGVHNIESAHPMGVLVAGYDQDVSYAYPGGLGLYKNWDVARDDTAELCSDGGWFGAPCDTGQPGRCAVGATLCGPHSRCLPQLESESERCNGIDDNCDGEIDEGSVCMRDVEFSFITPGAQLLELTEGDEQIFRALAGSDADGPLEARWYIDDPETPVARGDTLTWRVLSFESGVHRVWVEVESGDAHAEYEWLVHVHDAPTNSPTLYGQIFDRDGQALPGVPVAVREPGRYIEPLLASRSTTDFRGLYALTLRRGSHRLMLQAAGQSDVFPGGWIALGDVLLPSHNDERFDVTVPSATVSGYVYGVSSDGSSAPLANVRVAASFLDTTACRYCDRYLFTDEDGHYEMLLYAGEYTFTFMSPPGLGLTTEYLRNVVLTTDLRQDFFMDVPDTAELVVTIVESCTGDTVSGVPLRLWMTGFTADLTTDENGQIRLELPTRNVTISLNMYNPTVTNPQIGRARFVLGVVNVLDDDDVVFEITSNRVTGTFTDAEGTALPNVRLLFQAAYPCSSCYGESTTDESGDYELDLIEGSYRVRVLPPDESVWPNYYDPLLQPFHPILDCDTRLDLAFEPPLHRISGTATALRRDSEGSLISAPVDYLTLYLGGNTSGNLTTDAEGRFEALVVPGQYYLSLPSTWSVSTDSSFWNVLPTGGFVVWRSEDSLTATDAESPIELSLEPLELPVTLVSGRVTNIEGGGLGLDGVVLSWQHQNNSCYYCRSTVTTDEDGYYETFLYRPVQMDDGDWEGVYTVEIDLGEFLPAQTVRDIVLDGSVADLDFIADE